MRMDKYKDESLDEEPVVEEETSHDEFSRTEKNNRMYHETYLNSSVIDVSKGVSSIFGDSEEETLVEEEIPKEIYIEKNYDVDDFIEKAHANKENDNLMRSLVDTDYDVNKVNEKQDEISKLIEKIEEKEQQEDFFSDLLPDENSNTAITDPVFEETSLDSDTIEETKLETLIGDETFMNFAKAEEEKKQEDESFKDIIEPKVKLPKKLPLIAFIVSAVILLIVVILIIVLK
jgi:hypothetical protein